jgi:hypothetical protein
MKLNAKRWSILATGVLALSLVGAPTLAATPSADDPVATVNTMLDAIAAKDAASVPDLICDQYKADAAQTFDIAGQIAAQFSAMAPGLDLQPFLDGLQVTVDGREVTLVSNDGTNAVVSVAGSLVIHVDEAATKDLVRALVAATGQEATDALIDAVMPSVLAQVSQPQDITSDIAVVNENGAWLVCQPFGAGTVPSASGAPGASPAASPAA